MDTTSAVNQALVNYMTVSNSEFHEYCGSLHRLTDQNIDKATVFIVPGNGSGMTEFSTSAEGLLFIRKYTDCKNLVQHLNECWQQTNEPLQSLKDALLAQWIPLTTTFIEQYGMAMVPYDLRFALADIRWNVGLPALTWPTIFMLNLNGSIAQSDDVDPLGRVVSLLL